MIQQQQNEEKEEGKSALGRVFDVAAIFSVGSRASNHSERGDLARAIRLGEDCLERMRLVYGEMYPITLSAIYRLACDYASSTFDFSKAVSLHEDCLKKRREVLGDSSEDTLSSIAALAEAKSKVYNKKKSESPYSRMKTKDLIELVDRRKLSRAGLQEKSELVELLYSSTSVVEKRGVTLKLFRAFRQLALSRNADATYWTIARVSAMINGNHEILKADCRFGHVDPDTTLTFANKCPLIDVLLTNHFDASSKHPLLNLSYKEAVGEKANLFVSFAYTDNFIDLVDALELYLETHSKDYPAESTFFWFDTFLNNQWTASDQTFEFWANIFRETVEAIGQTLCFLSPWENPSILSRVWCLLEMRYSPRISIILSRREVSSFQKVLREDRDSISASLCKIKAENAASYVIEDRERIFAVIESIEGGVHAFNVKVMGLIRDWIAASARGIVATSSGSCSGISSSSGVGIDGGRGGSRDVNLTIEELRDMGRTAVLLSEQGRLDEAKKLFERALFGFERLLGPDDADTLVAVDNLAIHLEKQGRLEEAKKLYERALSGSERTLGPEHVSTLITVNNLAGLLYQQGRFDEAKKLYEKALTGQERALGPEHADTLMTVANLAGLLNMQGRFEEAKKLYERALSGFERSLGPDHARTLSTVNNLAALLKKQGRFGEAKKLYERALTGQERTLGPDHAGTLITVGNLANLLAKQGRIQEAKKLYERALSGYELALGPHHADTLMTVHNLADLFCDLGRFEEAKKLYERALTGRERSLGPDHTNTLTTVHNLADLLKNQGRFQEAKKLFERALTGFTRVLGPNHEKTKMASQNLALLKK